MPQVMVYDTINPLMKVVTSQASYKIHMSLRYAWANNLLPSRCVPHQLNWI